MFDFGDGCAITVSSPWRIVVQHRIAHADSDDGQWFGLSAPVDGQSRSNQLLDRLVVEAVEFTVATADIKILFDGETQIEIFNHSSGYEGWSASFCLDGRHGTIIGLGGGELAVIAADELGTPPQPNAAR